MRRLALSFGFLLLATPALALSQAPYITPSDADLAHLLKPPPAAGTPEQAADMAAVLAAQKARSPAAAAKAEADAVVTVFQFAEVLGSDFKESNLPKTTAFLTKLFRDANVLSSAAKDYWQRPRPFDVDPSIQPPGNLEETTKTAAGYFSYSYPSGHAAFGTELAFVLADMVPEKSREIFARGWQLGQSRIVGGVHYPTDVESGRINGTVMIALMMKNPAFRADMAEARAELRAALKLPP